MSVLTAPPARRLGRSSTVASGWQEFLTWSQETASELDPWLLYPFGTYGAGALPDLVGPVVYAALDPTGRCRYVGQSHRVRDRFRRHQATAGRRGRWDYVLIRGFATLPEGGLDEAERIAARILRPVEGTRHPRRR